VASLLAGLVLTAVALPQETAAVPSGAKDHVLFVGTDLSVKQDGEFYRVVGANKKALKIEKDHTIADVRLSGGANIRINKGVKLSNLSATIGRIKTESVDRESARAQLAAMQASMALMDEAGDNEDKLHGQVMILSAVAIRAGDGTGAPVGAKTSRENLEKEQAKAADSYMNTIPDLDRLTSATSGLLAQNLMQPDFDDEVTLDASDLPGLNLLGGSAIGDSGAGGSASTGLWRKGDSSRSTEVELTFEVSSPEPLENAYIVVVANYASLGNSGEAARQISAREFAKIDSHPQSFNMTHAASINGLVFKK
jgi:hypothetical protein